MPGWAGRVDELGGEPLYPAVHSDVIDRDTAFSEQLLNISVGQAVAQVPAHCDRDDLSRERKPANAEPPADLVIRSVSRY
jgi:hypothetical protein